MLIFSSQTLSTSSSKISYSINVYNDDSCYAVPFLNYESSAGWSLVFVLIYAVIHSVEISLVLSMYQAL